MRSSPWLWGSSLCRCDPPICNLPCLYESESGKIDRLGNVGEFFVMLQDNLFINNLPVFGSEWSVQGCTAFPFLSCRFQFSAGRKARRKRILCVLERHWSQAVLCTRNPIEVCSFDEYGKLSIINSKNGSTYFLIVDLNNRQVVRTAECMKRHRIIRQYFSWSGSHDYHSIIGIKDED